MLLLDRLLKLLKEPTRNRRLRFCFLHGYFKVQWRVWDLEFGMRGYLGVDQKLWAPFGPLDYKEYTIIQTPKGPIILINPHLLL